MVVNTHHAESCAFRSAKDVLTLMEPIDLFTSERVSVRHERFGSTPTTYLVSAAGGRTATRGVGVTSDLVERAQRGDHEAFDALASAAYHRLYAIARRILRDGYAAEDAVQDTLVRAWRDLWGLRDPGAFDAWLHRLLVRSCADHQRRTWKRRLDVDVEGIELPAGSDEVARLVDRDALERAFERLSFDHRAVVVLTHYAGHTGPEVAEILGIPVGTVSSRLHYALRTLRVDLAPSIDLTFPSSEQVR